MENKTFVSGVYVHVGSDEEQIRLDEWIAQDGVHSIVVTVDRVSLHVTDSDPAVLRKLAGALNHAACIRDEVLSPQPVVMPLHQHNPEHA